MFHESPRFPDYLAYGLQLGPMFATDTIRLRSGAESNNQIWAQPLRMWDGSTTHRTAAERAAIDNFFTAVAAGRANGFRLKDITDYKDAGAGVVYLVSGTTYQIAKNYVSGAQTHRRDIKKPVVGEVSIQGGGVYSALDTTTGRFTHTSGSAPTGWVGEFDVPVRFDHDQLTWELASRSGNGLIFVATELHMVEIRT
jgi:uncharacterized protein (TIGR02217 family)